ncbi:MAG TPA: DUF1080 domain-containing protein [Candidatus Cybelea sp.]|nr:DUF1080 domain-containing protein [Candidatus Cybelea sp.]
MKSPFFARALALVACLAIAGGYLPALAQMNDAAITPTNKIELFDGKSLCGWMFVTKNPTNDAAAIWSAGDGVIRCKGRPNGYARTLVKYRDYQLHAEWRWPAGPGNSGVFVHINGVDKVWPLCFEAQLLAGSAGEVRANGGSTFHELTPENPKSAPRRVPGTEKPPGEWNTYDIVCRSNTLTLRVNGVLQNEVTGTCVSEGFVGLQAEGKLVEFRNVFLEPLLATADAKQ